MSFCLSVNLLNIFTSIPVINIAFMIVSILNIATELVVGMVPLVNMPYY
jgi:hypothetical protein